MKYILIAAGMIALLSPALSQEPTKLDPADVVKQLYRLSDKSWKGAASYSIYADGSINFAVSLPNDQRVYGSGKTPEDALNDLRSKSDLLATEVVVKAEETRGSALSLVEGIKSMLFGNRRSQ